MDKIGFLHFNEVNPRSLGCSIRISEIETIHDFHDSAGNKTCLIRTKSGKEIEVLGHSEFIIWKKSDDKNS